MTNNTLDEASLDILFRTARSHSYWLDRTVSNEHLQQIYELMKFGPTTANSCPARLVFVKSLVAKQRLIPCLNEGNVRKSMEAPVVAIIGMDMEFYEKLPVLYPHQDARSWYAGKPDKIEENAFRCSSLQGAYFMLAARSLGLDCGPMGGFEADKINTAFFPEGKVKVNFICALGYGDHSKLHPRNPRLPFAEVCRIE